MKLPALVGASRAGVVWGRVGRRSAVLGRAAAYRRSVGQPGGEGRPFVPSLRSAFVLELRFFSSRTPPGLARGAVSVTASERFWRNGLTRRPRAGGLRWHHHRTPGFRPQRFASGSRLARRARGRSRSRRTGKHCHDGSPASRGQEARCRLVHCAGPSPQRFASRAAPERVVKVAGCRRAAGAHARQAVQQAAAAVGRPVWVACGAVAPRPPRCVLVSAAAAEAYSVLHGAAAAEPRSVGQPDRRQSSFVQSLRSSFVLELRLPSQRTRAAFAGGAVSVTGSERFWRSALTCRRRAGGARQGHRQVPGRRAQRFASRRPPCLPIARPVAVTSGWQVVAIPVRPSPAAKRAGGVAPH
jgi:hypothetical protein